MSRADDALVDLLLAQGRVPAMDDALVDRIVATAVDPDRRRPTPPPRRQWTRRGLWTAVLAVNIVIASAVAAAIGGGAARFVPAAIVSATHRVIEHISPHRVVVRPKQAARPRPILASPPARRPATWASPTGRWAAPMQNYAPPRLLSDRSLHHVRPLLRRHVAQRQPAIARRTVARDGLRHRGRPRWKHATVRPSREGHVGQWPRARNHAFLPPRDRTDGPWLGGRADRWERRRDRGWGQGNRWRGGRPWNGPRHRPGGLRGPRRF